MYLCYHTRFQICLVPVLLISFLIFSTCSHSFNNNAVFNVAFCCLPSCFSFICLNCLLLFNSYFQSNFLLHLTAFKTLSWFRLEYFVTLSAVRSLALLELGEGKGSCPLQHLLPSNDSQVPLAVQYCDQSLKDKCKGK